MHSLIFKIPTMIEISLNIKNKKHFIQEHFIFFYSSAKKEERWIPSSHIKISWTKWQIISLLL